MKPEREVNARSTGLTDEEFLYPVVRWPEAALSQARIFSSWKRISHGSRSAARLAAFLEGNDNEGIDNLSWQGVDVKGSDALQYRIRNFLRRRGLEVVRVHPNPSLLALHVARLLRHYEIDVVLDVGGRIGDYGVWLRNTGFAGRIISFEPVKASFAALDRRRIGDTSWQAINVALGASSEEREINVTGLTYFSSFLEPNDYSRKEFGSSSAVEHCESVQVRRLDDIWSELGIPSASRVYLKMDTQGWDLEVLRGASECLPHVVAVQSEVSVLPIYEGMPSWMDSLGEFKRLGFELSGFFPVNLDTKMRVIEFDCVAVRPDGDT